MDWDHLRFFAAVAHAGSLAGAARLLGVEHTTVARRLQALEKIMGQALFVRQAGSYQLTQAGQQLLPAVQAIEKAVRGVEQAALPDGSSAADPAGLVKVGATEGLGAPCCWRARWRSSPCATRSSRSICWPCRACCTSAAARLTS